MQLNVIMCVTWVTLKWRNCLHEVSSFGSPVCIHMILTFNLKDHRVPQPDLADPARFAAHS